MSQQPQSVTDILEDPGELLAFSLSRNPEEEGGSNTSEGLNASATA